MKKYLNKLIKYIYTFIGLIILLNILMLLSCLFDSKLIKDNVIKSSNILLKEGTTYNIKDISTVRNNNLTDAQIINEMYSIDNNHPYESYMKAKRNYKKNLTKFEVKDINGEGVTINKADNINIHGDYDTIEELHLFLNNRVHYSINSGRYWHGYMIFYRPLLIFFDIKQIRMILLIIYILLFSTLIYLIYKRFDVSKAIIYASSLICSNYFTASYSLESSPIFLIMMISSIIFILKIEKIKNINLYIFIIGCLTCFFDYLTVPLIALGMITSLYILKLSEENKDWKHIIKIIIQLSIIWFIGYASTWIIKWILYDITIQEKNSMFNTGFKQGIFRINRTGNYYYKGITVYHRILGFLYNMPLYILITTFIIAIINKFNYNINYNNKKIFAYLLISFMPISWYIVLSNHTIMHYYFVHRHILVFLLGVLLSINELLFSSDNI